MLAIREERSAQCEGAAMHALTKQFRASEAGATAIEYALICAIIGTVIIGISATGGSLTGLYDRLRQIVTATGG